jgi:hypothetical protein
MASIFFPLGPAQWPGHCKSVRHQARACADGADRYSKDSLAETDPKIVMVKRCVRLVRAEGLEPPQLSSLEPKSSASTNSAMPAKNIMSSRDAASGGLITWGYLFAAKKWSYGGLLAAGVATGLCSPEMVGIPA